MKEGVFSLPEARANYETQGKVYFVKPKNPAEYPQKLAGHNYYIAHGTADVAVPICEHSEKMQRLVGNTVYLEKIENGIHGTRDDSYYGQAVKKAFADYADYLI